jgi:hypothetical protein
MLTHIAILRGVGHIGLGVGQIGLGVEEAT